MTSNQSHHVVHTISEHNQSKKEQDQQQIDFDTALTNLKKVPSKRSNLENLQIVKVMSQIKFFKDLAQNYGQETLEICCSSLRYKCNQVDQILFKQGEIGDAFYIIMKGSVGVNINTYPSNAENSSNQSSSTTIVNKESKVTNKIITVNSLLKKPGLEFGKRASNAFVLSESESNLGSSKSELKIATQPVLQEVKILKIGDSFGELALLKGGKGAQRAATIISKELTHYAYLVKEDFQNILRDKEQERINQSVQFFQTVNLFQGLEENELKQIFLYCVSKIVKKNSVIYKQNSSSDFFYIIKYGEFQVLEQQQIIDKKVVSYYENVEMPSSFRNYHGKMLKETAISTLSTGQYFGHLEILQKTQRNYSIKCVSSVGELYAISSNDFLRKIYYHSKQYLKKRLNEDKQMHSDLYEGYSERSKDISEQNSHLLIQNSYDKQYYDKIINFNKKNSPMLPSVILNSPRNKHLHAPLLLSSSPSSWQSNQQQLLLQQSPILEKQRTPLLSLDQSCSRPSSSRNNMRKSMELSTLSVRILNQKNQSEQFNNKIFNEGIQQNQQQQLFSQTPRMIASNSMKQQDQPKSSCSIFECLSRKPSIFDNKQISHLPSLQSQVQSSSDDQSNNNNQNLFKQLDILISPFNRRQSHNLSIKIQKQFSVNENNNNVVESPQQLNREISLSQRIRKQKQTAPDLLSSVFTSPKIRKKSEFIMNSPKISSINRLNSPTQSVQLSSRNIKSIFQNLKLDSDDLQEQETKIIIDNLNEINIFSNDNVNNNEIIQMKDNMNKSDQSLSPLLNQSYQSNQLFSERIDISHKDEINDSGLNEDMVKQENNKNKIKQQDFYRNNKQLMEQKYYENHQKLLNEMQNIQEAEKQKRQQIAVQAQKIMNKKDGYRQLKTKLEGIQQAVEAKSEKGNVNKESKKEILNRFFSFVQNQDINKQLTKKVERYKFTDFRKYQKIMDEKTTQIKENHTKRKLNNNNNNNNNNNYNNSDDANLGNPILNVNS